MRVFRVMGASLRVFRVMKNCRNVCLLLFLRSITQINNFLYKPHLKYLQNPIIKRSDFVLILLLLFRHAPPPQDSGMGWVREFWSKTNILKWQN